MTARLKAMVRALSSLWLTLACLLVAAGIALAGAVAGTPIGAWIALPFAVLCLNLVAALVASPKLRRQGGLLGFHLALAALALLIAADRLVSMNGHVEVTEGTGFDAALVTADLGPLHPWHLDRVRFVQDAFTINYEAGVKRRDTRSTVLLPDEAGGWRKQIVGDDKPLVAEGYRFYTSFNKGFAPVLTYVDRRGSATSGAVHLPSYPLHHFKQGNSWSLPDESAALKLWLHIPDPVFEEDRDWQFRRPEDAVLVVIEAGRRHELRPGATLEVGNGKLRYEELRSWMGYTISYNPLVPWMLAAIGIGIAGLVWHMGQRMLRVPWHAAARDGGLGHVA